MKKYAKKSGMAVIFSLPFCLLFCLPLLKLESEKTVDLPIESSTETVLLYFGYPGCGKSCPDVLSRMAQAFNKYQISSIEFLFINILSNQDAGFSNKYANTYHKTFRTPDLDNYNRLKLMQSFGVNEEAIFSPDLNHSNYLFLMGRNDQGSWVLKRVFPDVESSISYLKKGIFKS